MLRQFFPKNHCVLFIARGFLLIVFKVNWQYICCDRLDHFDRKADVACKAWRNSYSKKRFDSQANQKE